MKRITRVTLVAISTSFAVAAVILLTIGFSSALTTTAVNLAVEIKAPEQVAVGDPFVANISYVNYGSTSYGNNLISAIIPEGTTFVASTDGSGDPIDYTIDGNVVSWTDNFIIGDSTWYHIYLVLDVDESLPHGTPLTVTATIAPPEGVEDADPDDNTAKVVTYVSEMAGSGKHAHARIIEPGEVLTYTIRINPAKQFGGGENGRWVTLTDTLPFSHQVRFLGFNYSGTITNAAIDFDGWKLQWAGQVYAGEPLTMQYRLGVEGDVSPGTVITNVAKMQWAGHQMQLGPVTSVVTMSQGALALGPHQAGVLDHDGVILDVPAGAVTDTTRFEIDPLPPDAPAIDPPGGLLFANRAFAVNAYRFGDPVLNFERPLTITVRFSDTDVAGLIRATLRLWTRQGAEEPWTQLGEPVQVMSNALAFTLDHLSHFALFGEGTYKVYLPLTTY
jgi:hypothetical protein